LATTNFGTGGALGGYGVTAQPNGTEGNANNDTDHTSDHVAPTVDPNFGIYSGTYTLGGGTPEPTGETDATTAGTPQDPGTDPFGNPIPDDQSNLTVDFGFTRTMSLGNRVWFDLNQNGVIDPATEVGIAGVTVELYQDTNGNGTFDGAGGGDTLIGAPDVTDSNGYYLFNDLQAGNYFVHIPNNPNWTAGTGALEGFQSTTPDAADNVDSNDNGIGTGDTNPTPGVTSELLTLAFNNLPTGETDLSNNPADGPQFRGTNNPSDNNSDLTRDFGFFTGDVFSIGNRIWLDDGGTTGTPNNGIQEGDEAGIPNVLVELYRPGDTPGVDTPIATDTTDANGYYIFDGLPPGSYVVHLPNENWTAGTRPLDGYLSTVDGTPDNDAQDNGINNPNPGANGISSGTVVLGGGTPEPSGEDESPTDGRGANGETDDNSNLTVDFGFVTVYDWGDNPDSYGTSAATNGPNHRIITGLYLGGTIDDETDGQPVTVGTSNNTGDGVGDQTDEDGMNPPPFVAGTTVDVDITVVNTTGLPANLVGWFDWNGNGTFEAGEGFSTVVPTGTNGVVQLTVDVPDTAEDLTGGNTYARLRLTNDPLTTSDPLGRVDSGEVEDYYIQVRDPGLLINKTDGLNAIVAGTFNTYTITIENSGADRINVRFLDEIPIATPTDAMGYDPETIQWTCVATNGASCIASDPAGTPASGGPFPDTATAVSIDEVIDIPRDGRIVYTIRARVNAQAGLVGSPGPLINVAQLPNEVPPITDSDETAVIFDPPFGVKSGTFVGGNIIRWTMVWYNPGASQPNVTIRDNIQLPQQLPATLAEIDLQCSGGGAGGTDSGVCAVNNNRIEWNGTMDTSSPADPTAALTISFNVLVPGPGTYDNVGVLSSPTLANAISVAAAVSNDPDAPPPSNDTAGISIEDPAVVKLADPQFALPGEDVTWTITISNPANGVPQNNLTVTDSVPPQLTIISASAQSGTVTITGQDVSWSIPTLAPGESLTMSVVTNIRDDITLDVPIVTNTAILDGTPISSAATVLTVTELPNTGETPWWRTALTVLGITTLSLGAAYVLVRRRQQMM
ncbi:MAG: SdrD B-like domain-containing protein, partial [Chloroflexota bacterium]